VDIVIDSILCEPHDKQDGKVRILIDGAPTILRYSTGTAEAEVTRWVLAVHGIKWERQLTLEERVARLEALISR